MGSSTEISSAMDGRPVDKRGGEKRSPEEARGRWSGGQEEESSLKWVMTREEKNKTEVRKENEDEGGNGEEVSKRGADGPAPSVRWLAEKWKKPEVMMTHSVKHPEAESAS